MAVDMQYQIPLFEDISDAEMAWLIANSYRQQMNTGDYFIREGDTDLRFCVVLEGEMQVSHTVQGVPTVIGTTPRGICCGQLNLLNDSAAKQTIQAIMPSTLMVFDQDSFRNIFSAVPKVGSRILRLAAERMAMLLSQETQQQKMAALGKLSAGLAHELNNPAAAARRSAQSLRETLPTLQSQTVALNFCTFSGEQTRLLLNLQRELEIRRRNPPVLSPVQRGDCEEAVAGWLDENGIENAWQVAPLLVNVGFTPDELTELAQRMGVDFAPQVISWLANILTVTELLDSVEQSTKRVSDMVAALKEYTYMDRARVVEDVDLQHNLEITLQVLHHKLQNIHLIRDYDPALPKIYGSGGDLNQVWTNLIVNAIEAMQGKGTLEIITRSENAYAMIEITDSGVGIPPDVLPHIFSPFFTTKGVGAVGLGLDVSYRIIQQHNASIEVQSQPGRTRFIVRIPVAAHLQSNPVPDEARASTIAG